MKKIKSNENKNSINFFETNVRERTNKRIQCFFTIEKMFQYYYFIFTYSLVVYFSSHAILICPTLPYSILILLPFHFLHLLFSHLVNSPFLIFSTFYSSSFLYFIYLLSNFSLLFFSLLLCFFINFCFLFINLLLPR